MLKKKYPLEGVRGIINLINRTSKSIIGKARRLGIKCVKAQNQYDIWTQEEIEFLELWYEPMGSAWCSKKLNRSYQAIINKAFTLKLKWNRLYIGSWNGNWQGGITKEYQKIRNSDEYKEWRLRVFKRDYFTCQCCKKVGRNIHAHHIKDFSSHVELRFDVNNGITLCDLCHAKLHNMPVLCKDYLNN